MKSAMLRCYREQAASWDQEWNLGVFNCGILGGHKTVQCLLKCIAHQLTEIVIGKGL